MKLWLTHYNVVIEKTYMCVCYVAHLLIFDDCKTDGNDQTRWYIEIEEIIEVKSDKLPQLLRKQFP